MGKGPKLTDLTGKKFHKLLVLHYDKPKWRCLCDCGQEKSIWPDLLKKGKAKSCGCIRSNGGWTVSPERSSYNSMINRCCNEKDNYYKNYGGRGIKVCDRWQKSFEDFLSDMGKRPEGFSLDRIINDGNYEPNNCRWASAIEQANNRKTNRFVNFNGKTQTISQWSRELGISKSVIKDRLNRGLSNEEALTPPSGGNCTESLSKMWEFDGESKTIKQWSEEMQTSTTKLRQRMNLGKDFGEVIGFLRGADQKFLHRCEQCGKAISKEEIKNKLALRRISEEISEYAILCPKHNPFDKNGNKKENFNMATSSKPINQLDKTSLEIIKTFSSIAEAARILFPTHKQACGDISKALTYKRICKGFMWEFAKVEEKSPEPKTFPETIAFDKAVLDQIWRTLLSHSNLLDKNGKDNESVLGLMAKLQAKYSVRNGE